MPCRMGGVSQPETDVEADSGAVSVFKIDVDCLSDEALDHDAPTTQLCSSSYACAYLAAADKRVDAQ